MNSTQISPARTSLGLIVSMVICFAASAVGALFTTPQIDGWYATLDRPGFAPPNWVFGPVWTILYAMMAVAVWMIWKTERSRSRVVPLTLFAIQLILNVFWSVLFFGMQNPFLAFLEIILLWILILSTILSFTQYSKPAAFLMVPYWLWVTFAMVLNYGFWTLNA